jgi:O-acetyl-ADP-ribose deacetylase (regulator of RNase III)
MSLVIEWKEEGENIFLSGCQWLACPTNRVGPMGAGLAKVFRDRYFALEDEYKKACTDGRLWNDGYFAWREQRPFVLCVPTKSHWKDKSTERHIDQACLGISNFVRNQDKYNDGGVESIAIPALGSGLGGIPWSVSEEIIAAHAESWARLVPTIKIYPPWSKR